MAALEIAHLMFLGSWNSEIFAAITGLVGTVTGIIIGVKKKLQLKNKRTAEIGAEMVTHLVFTSDLCSVRHM